MFNSNIKCYVEIESTFDNNSSDAIVRADIILCQRIDVHSIGR